MAPFTALMMCLVAVASSQTTFQVLPVMYISWVNEATYIDLNITTTAPEIAAGWAPSVHGMSGTGVAGYVTATEGLCVDYDAYDTDINPTDRRSTMIAWHFGFPSWIVCRLPKRLFAIRDGPQRVNVAVSDFNRERMLPNEHDESRDGRYYWQIDVVAGTVEPYTYTNLFYVPIIVAPVIFAIIGVVSRLCGIVLRPTQLMIARALLFLLLVAMVTVYCVLAGLPFATLTSTMYATGEGTMLLTGLVMFPVSKFFSVGLVLYGTSYERMVPWHVVLGVLLLTIGLLHGILAFVVIGVQEPNGVSYLTQGWLRRGNVFPIPGIVSWVFLIALSIPALLRRFSYDFFRFTHWLLVPFLVFAILHYILVIVAIAPAGVLFILDVIKRYVPTVIHGTAKVRDVTHSGDLVRVRLSVPWKSVDAGDYALLSLTGKCSNPVPHPITVADMNYETGEATFVIRKAGDWSTKLYDDLQSQAVTEMIVQGPYGSLMVPIAKVDRVLLFSGGIGVTPMFSIARAAIQAQRPVRFVWSLRHGDDVILLMEQLQHMRTLEGGKDVVIEIHVTSHDAPPPPVPASMNIEIGRGRPEIANIVESEAAAVPQGGFLGVYVCGPAPLVESAEAAATSHSNVLYHVETFDF